MIGDFEFLTSYVRHFSYGGTGQNLVPDGACQKRLKQFVSRTGDDIRIIVLCDGNDECHGDRAYVDEDYDLAVLSPDRILIRRALAEKAGGIDFAGFCRMFLEEEVFGVFDMVSDRSSTCIRQDEGTYGTSLEDYGNVIRMVREKYGEFLPFYQSLMIKDMFPLFLAEHAENEPYLKEILGQMDDDIICGCSCIPEDILLEILSLKHGGDIEKEFVYRNGRLKFKNLSVLPLKEIPFVVREMKKVKGRFNISGTVLLPLSNRDIEYFFMDSKNKRYDLMLEDGENPCFLGRKLYTRKRFQAQLPVSDKPVGIRFMYRYREMYQARVRIEFDNDFCIRDGYLFRIENRVLRIVPLRLRTKIKLFFTFPRKSIKMLLG